MCGNTRINSKPNNVLRKVWSQWGRKRQASLRPIVAVPGELYLISWWWKLIFSFCYHNDEAVFDKTKEFSDIKLYKKNNKKYLSLIMTSHIYIWQYIFRHSSHKHCHCYLLRCLGLCTSETRRG